LPKNLAALAIVDLEGLDGIALPPDHRLECRFRHPLVLGPIARGFGKRNTGNCHQAGGNNQLLRHTSFERTSSTRWRVCFNDPN
jgi:hypothetical protein